MDDIYCHNILMELFNLMDNIYCHNTLMELSNLIGKLHKYWLSSQILIVIKIIINSHQNNYQDKKKKKGDSCESNNTWGGWIFSVAQSIRGFNHLHFSLDGKQSPAWDRWREIKSNLSILFRILICCILSRAKNISFRIIWEL